MGEEVEDEDLAARSIVALKKKTCINHNDIIMSERGSRERIEDPGSHHLHKQFFVG